MQLCMCDKYHKCFSAFSGVLSLFEVQQVTCDCDRNNGKSKFLKLFPYEPSILVFFDLLDPKLRIFFSHEKLIPV